MGEKTLGEFILSHQCTCSEKSILKLFNIVVIPDFFPSLLSIICACILCFLGIVLVWIFHESNRNCVTS
jgi:hypothetical protein